MPENHLYYGDNLDVLRRYIASESVDLVYLDPPFNSNATYNVLFAEHSGEKAASQIKAFEDTWSWDEEAARSYFETVQAGGSVGNALQAFYTLLGDSNMMAYLAMMAPRLVELRRVLKATGSIYLHCDPTASHYLKLLMDAVFGPSCFRNEIVWHYYNKFQRGDIKMFARDHDVLLFYAMSRESDFRSVYEQREKPVKQLKRKWDADTKRIVNAKDECGHVIWEEKTDRKVDDVWRLPYIVPASKEGLGYPTQKPEPLLERIILASSNEGDVVLDPFCGCGTAVAVAHRLKRRWVGIDITHLAVNLMKHRLMNTFGESVKAEYGVIGEPTDVAGARQLAKDDPYQFQWWALGLVGARPEEQKKGADKGIDGRIVFHEGDPTKPKHIILSVKAGANLHRNMVHELRGVIDREGAAIGVLITMQPPTKPMREEAASAGFYQSPWGTHPRIQLFTVAALLDAMRIDAPPMGQVGQTFKKAPKAARGGHETLALDLDA